MLKSIYVVSWSSVDSSILPSEKPKPQPSASFDLKKFSTYFSLFKTESNTAPQKNEQQDSTEEGIQADD